MNTSEKYFLMVAQELSIGKVARKIFVSQQGLSDHIKRMEEFYGTRLFQRKPRLALTEAGKRLARHLRQIQILEHSLEFDIGEIKNENKGILRVGIHASRAGILLPLILPKYRALHPGIELSIFSEVGREMEQMLFRGQLDFFVANHPAPANGIKAILLMDERVFLVVSDNVLREHFPDKYPQCKEDFSHGVDITMFKNVPFIMAMESSNLRLFVDEYFVSKGIKPKTALQTNLTDMHFQFSAIGYGACFCPEMMLFLKFDDIRDKNLNIFPLLDYAQRNRVILAYLEGMEFPQYIQSFIDIVIELCKNMHIDSQKEPLIE